MLVVMGSDMGLTLLVPQERKAGPGYTPNHLVAVVVVLLSHRLRVEAMSLLETVADVGFF